MYVYCGYYCEHKLNCWMHGHVYMQKHGDSILGFLYVSK